MVWNLTTEGSGLMIFRIHKRARWIGTPVYRVSSQNAGELRSLKRLESDGVAKMLPGKKDRFPPFLVGFRWPEISSSSRGPQSAY
jgi:hypothetical protein